MASIERGAELCPDQGALQPCQHCGSTAAVIEVRTGAAPIVRRLCCGSEPWWLSTGGRAFFALHGVDVEAAAEAARLHAHGC